MGEQIDWLLHVGAHKTGTTHLQDILASERPILVNRGLDFLPRDVFRSWKIQPRVKSQYRDFLSIHRMLGTSLAGHIGGLRQNTSRILISEENLLGMPSDLLTSDFYPRLEKNLLPWANILKGQNVKIFISVRDFGETIVSAYSQVLRQGEVIDDFSRYKEQLLARKPSWLAQLRRIGKIFPKSEIRFWRFEDYIENPSAIIRGITNFDLDFPKLEIPVSTRTPSGFAIQKIQALDSSLSVEGRQEIIGQILDKEQFEEKFDPLSDAEKQVFSDHYRCEMALLNLEYANLSSLSHGERPLQLSSLAA